MDSAFYLTTFDGLIILNILERTEGWCWAMLYQRQSHKNENTPPSEVPTDWINNLKELGYQCHELKHGLLTENTKKRDALGIDSSEVKK